MDFNNKLKSKSLKCSNLDIGVYMLLEIFQAAFSVTAYHEIIDNEYTKQLRIILSYTVNSKKSKIPESTNTFMKDSDLK